jgi:hypothetical protein
MPLLQFLPYALAAYGGYKGYKSSKDAGGSGIQRLLGGATGAAMGYYGGQAGLKAFAPESFAAFGKSAPTFLPQLSAKGSDTIFKQAVQKEGEEEVKRNMLQKLLQRKRYEDGVFTGEYELDPMKAALGVGGLSFLSGAFEQKPYDLFQPTYNLAYGEFAEKRPDFRYIDPETGQEKVYDKVYIPEQNRPADAERLGPYEISRNRFKTGGLADIKKFNEGGINYLPSKVSHDENDAYNYVRASGYVEDGSGNGDKDEDTMLAQLADGEFVTRADGVLGAGIIAGANPKSIKDMREKGAKFFYEQQARYKRVFDLIKESNEAKQKN